MQLPQRPGRYPASRAIGVDHILIDDGGSSPRRRYLLSQMITARGSEWNLNFRARLQVPAGKACSAVMPARERGS